jgi:hypothetical protein
MSLIKRWTDEQYAAVMTEAEQQRRRAEAAEAAYGESEDAWWDRIRTLEAQLAGAVSAAWALNDAVITELRRTNDEPDPSALWQAVEAWQAVAPERGQ